MKKILTLSLFSFLLFFGCNQESEITSPVENNTIQKPNWIPIPAKDGLSTETIWSTSGRINGATGGALSIYESYPGGPNAGTVTVSAALIFEPGTFAKKKKITMTVDDQTGGVSYEPGMVFEKPVIYTITMFGLDLTGVNPDSVDFVYLAPDGSIEPVEYIALEVNKSLGKIRVYAAKLKHFSRYGFVN